MSCQPSRPVRPCPADPPPPLAATPQKAVASSARGPRTEGTPPAPRLTWIPRRACARWSSDISPAYVSRRPGNGTTGHSGHADSGGHSLHRRVTVSFLHSQFSVAWRLESPTGDVHHGNVRQWLEPCAPFTRSSRSRAGLWRTARLPVRTPAPVRGAALASAHAEPPLWRHEPRNTWRRHARAHLHAIAVVHAAGCPSRPAARGDRAALPRCLARPHGTCRARRRGAGRQRRPARPRARPLLPAHAGPRPGCYRLRIEVSDARGDLRPLPGPTDAASDPLGTTGRGLTLVAALADHWDCVPYPPSGKTVRAELLDITP